MRVPNFDALRRESVEAGIGFSYASNMHPNPRFYKYRWWVFWRDSACDGREFLDDKYAICTANAISLIKKLQADGECYWIYNRRISRHEPGVTPFDRTSVKWRDHAFAPSFDDDTDPQLDGFR